MGPGAIVEPGGTRFRVWAPRARTIALELDGAHRFELFPEENGWYSARVSGVKAGARYAYLLDGERLRPDPASRSQPDGVHAPSEVIDPGAFVWRHSPPTRPQEELVLYELHVGTFTREGTFDAAARLLDRLVELGVTAVELMPVASFPGARNWGYDGVSWFAPQASYGGPAGLRRFVDAAHGLGLQVIFDVIYNHLGPEGNYLSEFGPYFTSRHKTPWGDALDYDGEAAASEPVREHACAAAAMWVEEYHADGLRLDAVDAIADDSPRHLCAELTESIHALGRRLGRAVVVIAESDLGDVRVIEEPLAGTQAWGCDAQWADDLHHALHALVTGERTRYYVDFGRASELARAITDGFVFTGEPSRFRGRPFGTPSKQLPGERFVVCSQNHDQVGNRARGERLGALKPGCEHVAAATVLCAPCVPLLFMGEEHADPAPFLYFTDFGDPALARAVTLGRRRDFDHDEVPDPQDPETFFRSRIDLALGEVGRHAGVRRFYQELLHLRREHLALRALDKTRTDARADDPHRALWVRRWKEGAEAIFFLALSPEPVRLVGPAPRRGRWRIALDAGEPRFAGPAGATLTLAGGAPEVQLPGYGVVVCINDG